MKKIGIIFILVTLFFITGCFNQEVETENNGNQQEESVELGSDEGEIELNDLYEEAKDVFIVEELVFPYSYITDEIVDGANFDYSWQLAVPIGLDISEVTEYYEILASKNAEFIILNDSFDYTYGSYEGNITFGEHPKVEGGLEVWVHISESVE